MATEKLQILKMVQEGKINADEALQLLNALEPEGAALAPQQKGQPAQWLKVRVTNPKSGKAKVNVNVPIALLDLATKFVKPEQVHGVDLREVIRLVKEGARGRIVDVTDEDTGETVEVLIE